MSNKKSPAKLKKFHNRLAQKIKKKKSLYNIKHESRHKKAVLRRSRKQLQRDRWKFNMLVRRQTRFLRAHLSLRFYLFRIDRACSTKRVPWIYRMRKFAIHSSELARHRFRARRLRSFLYKVPYKVLMRWRKKVFFRKKSYKKRYKHFKLQPTTFRPVSATQRRTLSISLQRNRAAYYTKLLTGWFIKPVYPPAFHDNVGRLLEFVKNFGPSRYRKSGNFFKRLKKNSNKKKLKNSGRNNKKKRRSSRSKKFRNRIKKWKLYWRFIQNHRRQATRKLFLASVVRRHRRATLRINFEKRSSAILTPFSVWLPKKRLHNPTQSGVEKPPGDDKILFSKKTRSRRRRWIRIFSEASKKAYRFRVKRRAKKAAKYRSFRLFTPIKKPNRVSLFINSSRSNYFLTLVKSKKSKPRQHSTIKVFTAGILRNIKTARKRRDMRTFERLYIRVLNYLLSKQIGYLHQLKIKFNPKLKYSALKRYAIKKLLRLYRYKAINIRMLRFQIMRPHANRRRAPKRRRK